MHTLNISNIRYFLLSSSIQSSSLCKKTNAVHISAPVLLDDELSDDATDAKNLIAKSQPVPDEVWVGQTACIFCFITCKVVSHMARYLDIIHFPHPCSICTKESQLV